MSVTSPTILLIDDSPVDREAIRRLLHGQFALMECETATAALALLANQAVDCILVDYHLPDIDGLQLIEMCRKWELSVIMLTGMGGEGVAVEAMKRGADDYLIKGQFDRAALCRAIAHGLEKRLLRGHIARQKQALEDQFTDLKASEARYRQIIETTHQGFWMIDAAAKTTFMNRRMAAMLGYAEAEVVGKPMLDFVVADDHAATLALVTDCERMDGQSERRLRRKDGQDLWVHFEAAPFLDGSGDYTGRLAMVVDITERKRIEAALLLSESQLRQAQKMEAIGQLAGGVAHDFNNLLSVILGNAELLLVGLPTDDPMGEDLNEILIAGQRAADLTRQLLMFSRQQVLESRILDLNEILTGMDKMLRRIVGEDIDLVVAPGHALRSVRADPGSVEQVIMNLVVNARDAMPTGGTITMETADVVLDEAYARDHLGVVPGPHVMLAISDTGTGMDKATIACIFEPFFTTKAKDKGTGLGLSTVFGIVQQSGGSVWVYSEPGEGTTFKVYLPCTTDPVEAARPPMTATTLRGSETILLVEDENQVRVITRDILRTHGYTVIEARHADDALLQGESYAGVIHLLLSDVVMPRMSGPILAKRLTEMRPDMQVLCMSGYTDDSIVRHGVLVAEMNFLQKPITTETLTRKVREVLDSPSR